MSSPRPLSYIIWNTAVFLSFLTVFYCPLYDPMGWIVFLHAKDYVLNYTTRESNKRKTKEKRGRLCYMRTESGSIPPDWMYITCARGHSVAFFLVPKRVRVFTPPLWSLAGSTDRISPADENIKPFSLFSVRANEVRHDRSSATRLYRSKVICPDHFSRNISSLVSGYICVFLSIIQ